MADPSMDPTQQGDDSAGAPGMSPLVKLYMLHRSQGLSEVDAAQKAAAALRGEAEVRSSFRDARDLFLHRQPTGDAYRSQLMGEADQPLKDVQARNAASDEAMKNTLAQGKLQATDFENQQIAEQQDPNSQSSQLARQSLKSMLPNVATGLGPDFDRASAYHIYKAVPQLKEMAGSGKDVAAAGVENATAGKTRAETAQVAPNAAAARGLQVAETGKAGAEAGKAQAEAGKIRAETGSSPTPGWERTGEVPFNDATAKEFQDKAAGVSAINANVDKILGIMGDKNMIMDVRKRAQAAPIVSQLFFNVKKEAQLRGLPMQDIHRLEQGIGDPTKWTAANAVGITQNAERLKSFKDTMNRDLDAYGKTHGYRRVGSATQPQTPQQPAPGGRPRRTAGGVTKEWDGKAWVATNG